MIKSFGETFVCFHVRFRFVEPHTHILCLFASEISERYVDLKKQNK